MTQKTKTAEARAVLKQQILIEIAAHMRIYGRTKWYLICDNPTYASLIGPETGASGKRTFMRWVNAVCEASPADRTKPHEGREVATTAMDEATLRARRAVARNIPAAPSPAYMLRQGARAEARLDILEECHLLWEDALLLRDHALEPDEKAAAGCRIRNMKVFEASIECRSRVLLRWMETTQEVWDLRYQQRFYDAISDIIVRELQPYPDVQERVIAQLEKLNKSSGMTHFV